jgi:hypothetical protein
MFEKGARFGEDIGCATHWTIWTDLINCAGTTILMMTDEE